MAVFAYHLGIPGIRGGFLGVDIFFVLSGYLITGLLLDEYSATAQIDIIAFWTRRARRLFPALILMALTVALAVREFSPITDWAARRSDLIWTVIYGANWHQISTSQDYFAQ